MTKGASCIVPVCHCMIVAVGNLVGLIPGEENEECLLKRRISTAASVGMM